MMPLPLTVSCFSKIQIGFAFLVPAPPGSPGQRAIKWLCVCVWGGGIKPQLNQSTFKCSKHKLNCKNPTTEQSSHNPALHIYVYYYYYYYYYYTLYTTTVCSWSAGKRSPRSTKRFHARVSVKQSQMQSIRTDLHRGSKSDARANKENDRRKRVEVKCKTVNNTTNKNIITTPTVTAVFQVNLRRYLSVFWNRSFSYTRLMAS